jgi:signal transduction histidine kinase
MGVPADQIPLLFNRFFRGDYSRNSPGSGLGLSIAKKIAESHGGIISAETNEPHGLVITVLLPAADPRREEDTD